jgi:hypothetical protein
MIGGNGDSVSKGYDISSKHLSQFHLIMVCTFPVISRQVYRTDVYIIYDIVIFYFSFSFLQRICCKVFNWKVKVVIRKGCSQDLRR